MTEPIKPDELAEIVARAEAATPGPVTLKPLYREESPHARIGFIFRYPDGSFTKTFFNYEPNAIFYAHAREDVPRLAAEVARLQEYSEEVRKGINATLREYARANTRLAAIREKAEKIIKYSLRDFTLELETAIADLAAALEEK